jgi:hypothetical protein
LSQEKEVEMSIEHATVREVEARQPIDLPKDSLQEKATPGPRSKQPVIEKYLQQLGRFGQPHVQEYLYDLKRRNCRPNTLRSYVTAWKSFFPVIALVPWNLLEELIQDQKKSNISLRH